MPLVALCGHQCTTESEVCDHISGEDWVWYVCDVLYAVLYHVCLCQLFCSVCNEPTSCLVQPIDTHGGEVVYCWCVCFRGELGFLNCDYIYMCVVDKQYELLEFVFYSVYVDLQYDEISFTSTTGYASLFCVCSHLVVFGLSVSLSWYPMWMRWLL